MKTPLIAICLLAAAALLSACSTQPVVSAQARQGVDMRAFKTYAFKPGAGADADDLRLRRERDHPAQLAVADGVVDVVAAFVAGDPIHVVNPDALSGSSSS